MILIVDDDDAVRLSLRLLLTRNGYTTAEAATPREAVDVIRATAPQLVMLDMNYSRSTTGEEGLTLLKQIKVFRPETPVIPHDRVGQHSPRRRRHPCRRF